MTKTLGLLPLINIASLSGVDAPKTYTSIVFFDARPDGRKLRLPAF